LQAFGSAQLFQDDIHTIVGYRQVLDFPQTEFDVFRAHFFSVPPRFGQHLGCHVNADDAALVPHLFGGEKSVELASNRAHTGPYADLGLFNPER
jgi:hypothetical protein